MDDIVAYLFQGKEKKELSSRKSTTLSSSTSSQDAQIPRSVSMDSSETSSVLPGSGSVSLESSMENFTDLNSCRNSTDEMSHSNPEPRVSSIDMDISQDALPVNTQNKVRLEATSRPHTNVDWNIEAPSSGNNTVTFLNSNCVDKTGNEGISVATQTSKTELVGVGINQNLKGSTSDPGVVYRPPPFSGLTNPLSQPIGAAPASRPQQLLCVKETEELNFEDLMEDDQTVCLSALSCFKYNGTPFERPP